MTKREAEQEQRALERAGWADVRIVSEVRSRAGRVRVTHGVSAVDPTTGVRTGTRWEWADRLSVPGA